MPKRDDVRFSRLKEVSWQDENAASSLEQVFNHTIDHANTLIEWYLTSKKSKKICAQWLRLSAIFLSTLGGLFPIIATAAGLSALWATILLGLAAMCVAIDRFFGCSSAWMRFITAEYRIRRSVSEYQITLEQLRASWHNAVPDGEQVQTALDTAKTFIVDVENIVIAETAQWRSEFQNVIQSIDNSLKQTSGK